jgi:GNAT superfamily N-acetyltransferase
MAQRTGDEEKHGFGTIFELKLGPKVIAKALCSYINSPSGPTIERIETAEEWQGHGFGKMLLKGMESYFEWFIEQGFEDWDGMGEKMGSTCI